MLFYFEFRYAFYFLRSRMCSIRCVQRERVRRLMYVYVLHRRSSRIIIFARINTRIMHYNNMLRVNKYINVINESYKQKKLQKLFKVAIRNVQYYRNTISLLLFAHDASLFKHLNRLVRCFIVYYRL